MIFVTQEFEKKVREIFICVVQILTKIREKKKILQLNFHNCCILAKNKSEFARLRTA